MGNCLFCSMVSGDVETNKAYEDESAFAFHDIDPKAPVHILIIPKKHIASVRDAQEADEQLLGHLLLVAKKVAKEFGINDEGYRIVINNGDNAGQEVGHLHVHLLGGRKMSWPPG